MEQKHPYSLPEQEDKVEEILTDEEIPYSRKRIFWLIGGIILIAIGAVILFRVFHQDLSHESPAPQEDLPFSVTTDAPMEVFFFTDGKAENSTLDYIGEPVLFHFFTVTEESLPDLRLLAEAAVEHEKSVRFLLIAYGSPYHEAEQFLQANDIKLACHAEPEGTARGKCGFLSNSATYFVDEEGFIQASSDGSLTEEVLAFGIGLLLPPAVIPPEA